MKERMITRTVSATIANVSGINIKEGKMITEEITMTGIFKNDSELLKAIKEAYDGETVYAVINATEIKETLYGMPESVFMKYANELPPRNTKTE